MKYPLLQDFLSVPGRIKVAALYADLVHSVATLEQHKVSIFSFRKPNGRTDYYSVATVRNLNWHLQRVHEVHDVWPFNAGFVTLSGGLDRVILQTLKDNLKAFPDVTEFLLSLKSNLMNSEIIYELEKKIETSKSEVKVRSGIYGGFFETLTETYNDEVDQMEISLLKDDIEKQTARMEEILSKHWKVA